MSSRAPVSAEVANPDRHGNGAGEPEERGEHQDTQGGQRNDDAWEDEGRNADVKQDEDGPDAVEELEVELGNAPSDGDDYSKQMSAQAYTEGGGRERGGREG